MNKIKRLLMIVAATGIGSSAFAQFDESGIAAGFFDSSKEKDINFSEFHLPPLSVLLENAKSNPQILSLEKARQIAEAEVAKTKRSISSSKNSNRNNKNLYHIEEENSDEEKDSLLKRLKRKNTFQNTERGNISAKKPTEGSKEYSDSSSLYFNSSSSEYKNNTESNTHKANDENNFFDLSTFSSNGNNNNVYPYNKEEINNEQFPFENINFNLDCNNDIFLNGIVPKVPFYNIYGKPRMRLNNNFENKYLKKKSKFSILTISNFNFKIDSNTNKIYNSQIIIYQNLNKKIELKIVKNESFKILVRQKVNKFSYL